MYLKNNPANFIQIPFEMMEIFWTVLAQQEEQEQQDE